MSKFHTTEFDFYPERAFRSRAGRFGPMTLEGSKGSSAPAADPRMGEAANRQIALAEKQYADYNAPGGDREWMRQTAEEYMAISRKTGASAQKLSDYQRDSMEFNDKRYRDVAIPFEDKLLDDVNRFDSAGYKEGQVSSAMADVQSATDSAKAQTLRGDSRMGINPNSGRSAALKTQMDMGTAATMAGTANKTRLAADQVGLASKMQMYGGMKGLAGLGSTNAGLATGAMGMGLNSGAAMQGAAAGSIGANNAAAGVYNQGTSAGINGLGQMTQLNQNAVKINNDNDPFASILGAGAQMGAAYL
jgi:hypothetical protein